MTDDEIEITIEDEPEETIEVEEPSDADKPEPDKKDVGQDDGEYTVDTLDNDSAPKIEKRRLSSKEKRDRQREQRAKLEAKLSALQSQNLDMQRRLQAAEGGQLGLRLEGIKDKKEELQRLYNQATQNLTQYEDTNNLKGVRHAAELRYRIENEFKALEQQENQIQQIAQRPAPLDNTTVNYFKGWVDRNKTWYKSDLSNRPSRIADDISRDLVTEGFSTGQPEFWEELDRRCSEEIPAKAKTMVRQPQYDDSDDDDAPPQTVSGKGRTPRSDSGRQEIKIDKWTVEQWKTAGIWDDPKERAKAIKEYQSQMEKEKQRYG